MIAIQILHNMHKIESSVNGFSTDLRERNAENAERAEQAAIARVHFCVLKDCLAYRKCRHSRAGFASGTYGRTTHNWSVVAGAFCVGNVVPKGRLRTHSRQCRSCHAMMLWRRRRHQRQ